MHLMANVPLFSLVLKSGDVQVRRWDSQIVLVAHTSSVECVLCRRCVAALKLQRATPAPQHTLRSAETAVS